MASSSSSSSSAVASPAPPSVPAPDPDQTPGPSTILASLTSSLESMEDALSPLFNQAWSDTLSQLSAAGKGKEEKGKGTLDRAKMDVMVSYAINDLLWIYLKLRGIDPATHEVTKELDRIQTYYSKIRSVEFPDTRERPVLNTAAAKRFITSSIPRAQHLPASTPPTTSAAAAAQEQARRAVAEAEEKATMNRLGKANRFRFISQDRAGDKVLLDQGGRLDDLVRDAGEEEDEKAGDEDEDEDEDEDGDTTMRPAAAGSDSDEAGDFLRKLDQEIAEGINGSPSTDS